VEQLETSNMATSSDTSMWNLLCDLNCHYFQGFFSPPNFKGVELMKEKTL
jgi:hypothetical protein